MNNKSYFITKKKLIYNYESMITKFSGKKLKYKYLLFKRKF